MSNDDQDQQTTEQPAATETCDTEGLALYAGDTVRVWRMDDGTLQKYVGKEARVEWVQDVPPYAQVILVFEGDPDHKEFPPMSTFAAWVRKVS